MNVNRRIFRTIVAVGLLTRACLAEKLEVALVVEHLVRSRLESGAVPAKQRQAVLRNHFSELGCTVEEQRVERNAGNVICTLPGQTNSTIIVGGHFDFAEHGSGIVDDWSGASLLPSLYQALKLLPRRHTYVFVAFAAEERGLVGSSRYVKSFTKDQKALVRAFVNIECLGLSPVKVWLSRATPALVTRLDEIAAALAITLQAVNVEKVGDDDSHPFLSAHIPVITIHSLTQETLPILHSDRDQLNAIHFDDYYTAYKLIAYYLAYLDLKLE